MFVDYPNFCSCIVGKPGIDDAFNLGWYEIANALNGERSRPNHPESGPGAGIREPDPPPVGEISWNPRRGTGLLTASGVRTESAHQPEVFLAGVFSATKPGVDFS